MTKKQRIILEKIFTAEIDGRLPCQLRDSVVVQWLLADGQIERVEVKLPGRFPITISGYILTHRGRIAYCQWATKECEKEGIS